tara:strand:- start:75 stop:866 length:792 start_codon:yes stop_codon:yes gene_type:complete
MEIKTYKQHYLKCLENYNSNTKHNLYDVSIQNNCVDIDKSLLNIIAKDVKQHLNLDHDTIDSKWATYVNDFNNISGLDNFCSNVIEQLEQKYFNSYVKIENLHILKNKKFVPLESSWVWHYDDCPKEFLKFAVYLNDVTEDNGPMQIVLDNTGKAPVIESFRDHPGAIKGVPTPVFPKSRVPQSHVDSIIQNGGLVQSLTGKAGTNFLFTPNIIHRGTVPKPNSDPRLAIFMFIRPSINKISKLVSLAKPKKANVNVKKYDLN